jgi:hypothetical protein
MEYVSRPCDLEAVVSAVAGARGVAHHGVRHPEVVPRLVAPSNGACSQALNCHTLWTPPLSYTGIIYRRGAACRETLESK